MTDEEQYERYLQRRDELYDNFDFDAVARLDLQIQQWEKADRCKDNKVSKIFERNRRH